MFVLCLSQFSSIGTTAQMRDYMLKKAANQTWTLLRSVNPVARLSSRFICYGGSQIGMQLTAHFSAKPEVGDRREICITALSGPTQTLVPLTNSTHLSFHHVKLTNHHGKSPKQRGRRTHLQGLPLGLPIPLHDPRSKTSLSTPVASSQSANFST